MHSNLSRPFHCAAGSLKWVLHKDIFHHIYLHTLLPAHRAADHIHWDETESHMLLNISNIGSICDWIQDIYSQNQPKCLPLSSLCSHNDFIYFFYFQAFGKDYNRFVVIVCKQSDSRGLVAPSTWEFGGAVMPKFLEGEGKHFLQKECRHGRSFGSRLWKFRQQTGHVSR